MSTEENSSQVNVELLLYPVIGTICKYVDQRDLSNVAKVCRTWCHEALHEDKKRSCIRQLRFPYRIDNLVGTLKEIPSVSLLVYDSALENLLLPGVTQGSLEEELLELFKRQLPKKTIVWRVDKYITSEDILSSDNQNQYDRNLTDDNMLGLFLPCVERRLRVHVASFQEVLGIMRHNYRAALVNQLAEDLGLNESNQHNSAILMFSNGQYYNTVINELISRTRQTGKEAAFASFFGNNLVAKNCNSEVYKNRKKNILLRISGPNLECWSTYIDNFAQQEEIDHALRNLKKQVRSKRFCKGLFFAHRCMLPDCLHFKHPCGNSQGMMNNLKRTFPGIRFVGFYENYTNEKTIDYTRIQHNFSPPGVKDFLLVNSLRNFVSIIIMSYD